MSRQYIQSIQTDRIQAHREYVQAVTKRVVDTGHYRQIVDMYRLFQAGDKQVQQVWSTRFGSGGRKNGYQSEAPDWRVTPGALGCVRERPEVRGTEDRKHPITSQGRPEARALRALGCERKHPFTARRILGSTRARRSDLKERSRQGCLLSIACVIIRVRKSRIPRTRESARNSPSPARSSFI